MTARPDVGPVPMFALILAACWASGCTDGDEGSLDPLCDEVGEGSTVIAGPDSDNAPLVAVDAAHLVSLQSGEAGYVRLQIKEPGSHRIVLDQRNLLRDLTLDDDTVGLPAAVAIDACPSRLPATYTVSLDAAGQYTLELGPSGVTEAWLLVEGPGADSG